MEDKLSNRSFHICPRLHVQRQGFAMLFNADKRAETMTSNQQGHSIVCSSKSANNRIDDKLLRCVAMPLQDGQKCLALGMQGGRINFPSAGWQHCNILLPMNVQPE